MINSSSYKAMTITFLLSGSLLLSIFNMTLPKYEQTATAEKFYQVEDVIHEKVIEEKATSKNTTKTNRAYNKATNPKHFAQAYKPIAPPEDFKFNNESKTTEAEESPNKASSDNSGKVTLDNSHLTAYNSVNSILSKRSHSIKASRKAVANTNSSIYYSLKNRTHEYLPIPIYLCESTGKIVVNITVNIYGEVTRTSINSSSTSFNECLVDHALEYAKEARFNAGNNEAQIGTITFNFKGK